MTLQSQINETTLGSSLEGFLSTIDYRVARTKEELEKAFCLVYKEYLRKGYTGQNLSQLRLSIFNALPETTTFIAENNGNIVSTITLIPDSPLGFPMDELYREELKQLRKDDKKLAEVSMLASSNELFQDEVNTMLNSKKLFFVFFLFKTLLDYATKFLKLDYLCAVINPRHSLVYDFLLFKQLGDLKSYRKVNDAPAIAKYLDLHMAEEQCRKKELQGLLKMFFLRKTDEAKFKDKFEFSETDLKYFFADKSDILKNATPAQIEYLKICYPKFNLSKLI